MKKKIEQDNSNLHRNMRNAINMAELSDEEMFQKNSDKIKLKFTTTTKNILNFLAILFPILLIITLTYYHIDSTIFNNFPLLATLFTGIFLFMWKNYDEYYVIDKKRKALMIKRIFFSINTYKQFAHFNIIDAVVANGYYNMSKRNTPSYWTYRAEIVLKTGKVIPIEDWSREDFLKADIAAKHFADVANITFVQGKQNRIAKKVKIGGRYSFTLVKRRPMSILEKIFFFFILPVLMSLLLAYLRSNLRLVNPV